MIQQKPLTFTFNTLIIRNTYISVSMRGILLLTFAVLAQSLSPPPQLDLVSTTHNLTAGPSFNCDMRYGVVSNPESCHEASLKIPIYEDDQKFINRQYTHGPDDAFVKSVLYHSWL